MKIKRIFSRTILLTSAIWVSISVQLQAGVIITPVGVSSSTSATDLWAADRLIDDSGLSGSSPHGLSDTHAGVFDTFPIANSWTTTDPGGFPSDYFANGPSPVLTFDLGGSFLLNQIHIWNYVLDGNGNQTKTATLEFSTTGTGGLFGGSVAISLLPVTFPGSVQTISFAGVNANAARLTIQDNYFGIASIGGDRVGLSEVKFDAVPEPTSFAIFGLMGLAACGFRRSRSIG